MILFGFTKKSGAALVHPGTMLSQGPSCYCKAGLCKEHGNRPFLCFYSFCGYPGVGFETKLEDSCPAITANSDQRCVHIWVCLKIWYPKSGCLSSVSHQNCLFGVCLHVVFAAICFQPTPRDQQRVLANRRLKPLRKPFREDRCRSQKTSHVNGEQRRQ